MELRPYQIQSVEQLRDAMKKHKHVVLCLPTGAGKSVIFSELVRLTAHKSKRVLVLTHRIELFTSTFRHLENRGIVPEVISPQHPNPNPFSLVIVAMVETLQKRIKRGLQLYPDLLIIDEAHFGNFTKIIEAFPESYIIGVTATPVGKHFHKHYTKIVSNADIPYLVENKFLMPCRCYQMEDDLSDVKVTSMGEYENDSLFNHYNKKTLYDGVVYQWVNLVPNKKTLVFNVNIAHTIAMSDAFNAKGIDSRYVTSLTPAKEREQILADFKNGLFPVLNNCGILTTGYDEPSIEAIIMNRATLSLPLWLQCQGRGSRPFGNKTHFTVIDFGLNVDQHGLWDAHRVWSLKPPRKKKLSEAMPIKTCKQCRAVLHTKISICPYCGYEFEQKEKELTDGIPVLKTSGYAPEKISAASLEKIVSLQQSGRLKSGYVWRVVRSRGITEVEKYAKLIGYKSGWVWRQKSLMGDCKFRDQII